MLKSLRILVISAACVAPTAASADEAADLAEASQAVEQVDQFIDAINRAGLPVPPSLLKAAGRFNKAVGLGLDVGDAAQEAHEEVQKIVANRELLCDADPVDKYICLAGLTSKWQSRNVNAVLNWNNQGSVVRRVASKWTGIPRTSWIWTGGQNQPSQPAASVVQKAQPALLPTAPVVHQALHRPTVAVHKPPGGVSLTRAAADRLSIDMDLDASYAEDGRIVLGGYSGRGMRVDAALFLTSLRLACAGNDPYFSLDPDDGGKWTAQGRSAGSEIFERIKLEMKLTGTEWSRNIPEGLNFRSFSARRDFAHLWATVAPKYPDLKSRLVFKPQWLGDTRFGEIFYVADVLLKELSGGVPTVDVRDRDLRARAVDGYVSARVRSAGEGLLAVVDGGQRSGQSFSGNRFWFDLMPRAQARMRSMLDDDPEVAKAYEPKTVVGSRLKAELMRRGVQFSRPQSDPIRLVSTAGGTLDLSRVVPTMFVIGHDNRTGKDVNGDDPIELAVADDVNQRMQRYIAAYQELKQLTEAFRLYVAAVAIVKRGQSKEMCATLGTLPLLPGEKASRKLPEFHGTDLLFTVASYRDKGAGGGSKSWYASSSAYYGGVAPSGIKLYTAADQKPTPITQVVSEEIAGMREIEAWNGKSGRTYQAFLLTDTVSSTATVSPATSPVQTPQKPQGMLDDIPDTIKGQVRQ